MRKLPDNRTEKLHNHVVATVRGPGFLSGCALLTLASLVISGCGVNTEGAPSGESEAIVNGNAPLPLGRPYEANFAQMWNKTKGGKCTTTLMGPTRNSATWALTAAHCFNSSSDDVSIIPQSGPHLFVTQIEFAPTAPVGMSTRRWLNCRCRLRSLRVCISRRQTVTAWLDRPNDATATAVLHLFQGQPILARIALG